MSVVALSLRLIGPEFACAVYLINVSAHSLQSNGAKHFYVQSMRFFSPLLSLAVVAIVIKHIRNPKRENAADCNRLRANYAYAINIEAPRGEWEQCIMLFPFEHFRIFTVHRAGALSFTDSSMPQLRSCAKKCIPINEYVCAPNKCSFPFIVLFLFVSLTQ